MRKTSILAWAWGICLAPMLLLFTQQILAQGTIVYHAPQSTIYYGPLSSSLNIDLNEDGIPDLCLASDGPAISLTPLNGNQLVAIPANPPDIGAWVAPLNLGTSISSSLNPSYVWYDSNFDGIGAAGIVDCMDVGCIGYFMGDTDAYAGLMLNWNGSTYYGWLQIHNFGLNFGQVLDWAYEIMPDTPILAGAVPEPSAGSLIIVSGFLLTFFHKVKCRATK